MKTFMKCTAVLMAVLLLNSPTIASATTASFGPINVSAIVSSALSLSVVLRKNSSIGAIVPAMAFGTLTDDDANGTLRSSINGSTATASIVALISATSTGLPYVITQSSPAAMSTGGGAVMPAGACTVVPVYAAADNGGAVLVGTMGTAGSWVSNSKVLYTSDAIASLRVIQANYSITDDPAAGATTIVPTNQAAGTYNGNITITVTA